jgi:hypothetical protein
VLGIDEDFTVPEALGNFRPRNELPLARCQQDKQFQGLAFDSDALAVAEEFELAGVEPKFAEFVDGTGHKAPFRG